jgi:hypothetical protein
VGLESVVETWINDPSLNYGFIVENDRDGQGELSVSFYSKEYSDSAYWPYLRIETTGGDSYNDDINPIPEPASMILLGSLATGLFGAAAVRKRKRT